MSTFNHRMSAKIAESGKQHRTDLSLHDTRVIDNGRAMRILAVYVPLKGVPSVPEVTQWLSASLGDVAGEVHARMGTLAVYPDQSFFTVILERAQHRQSVSALPTMVKASPDTYAAPDDTLWQLVQRENGPPFLLRRESASIEDMVNLRKDALRGGWNGRGGGVRQRKNITLASVGGLPSAVGGNASVGIDDVVDFLANGEEMRGTVKSMTADGVKIKPLGGGTAFTVDPQAIISVVEQSARTLRERDDITRDYWKNVYAGNPEMAKIISPNSNRSTEPQIPVELEKIELGASAEKPENPTERAPGKHLGVRFSVKKPL